MLLKNLDPNQERRIRRTKAREMTADAVQHKSPLGFLAAAELWEDVGEYETARTCAMMAKLITLVESDVQVKIIIPQE